MCKKHFSDQTHFYTKSATELITNYTAETLNIKARKLDFDELFHSEKRPSECKNCTSLT